MKNSVSVVIPSYNEANNLSILIPNIFFELKNNNIEIFEVIIVDDGSTDSTRELIANFANLYPNLTLINLVSNRGQSFALFYGIQQAKNELIITLDADNQNDPKDFKNLLAALDENIDCVCGRRSNRKDKIISRKLVSRIANIIIQKISKLQINDFGCTLRIYKSDAIKNIPIYGEIHRFLPAYLKLYGYKVIEVNVSHNKRTYGKSNYGLSRIHRVILDMLVLYIHFNYRDKPIHLFGSIGLFSFASGISIFLISIILKIFNIRDFVETPLILLGSLFFLSGVFILLLGILAELELFRDKKINSK